MNVKKFNFSNFHIGKNKKGVEMTLQTIIVAVLLLVVLFVLISVFARQFGKSSGVTESRIDCLTQDKDEDGVVDAIDSCCPSPSGSDVDIKGCAEGEVPHRDCGC
ncbi:MAG: hypothetical protein KAU20_02795 [Nanoarchaeota archaeon]|nr:hypothetical protein [Nanoarchaeota archaeon]